MNIPPTAGGWKALLRSRMLKPVRKLKPYERILAGGFTWNIVQGDLVQVIRGKEAGKQGKVRDVLKHNIRVVVEGINKRRNLVKQQPDGTPAKVVFTERSLPYSSVQLVDPVTKLPTRIRIVKVDGKKQRVSVRSGAVLYRPRQEKTESHVLGPSDTAAHDAFQVTFADYEKFLPYIYRATDSRS